MEKLYYEFLSKIDRLSREEINLEARGLSRERKILLALRRDLLVANAKEFNLIYSNAMKIGSIADRDAFCASIKKDDLVKLDSDNLKNFINSLDEDSEFYKTKAIMRDKASNESILASIEDYKARAKMALMLIRLAPEENAFLFLKIYPYYEFEAVAYEAMHTIGDIIRGFWVPDMLEDTILEYLCAYTVSFLSLDKEKQDEDLDALLEGIRDGMATERVIDLCNALIIASNDDKTNIELEGAMLDALFDIDLDSIGVINKYPILVFYFLEARINKMLKDSNTTIAMLNREADYFRNHLRNRVDDFRGSALRLDKRLKDYLLKSAEPEASFYRSYENEEFKADEIAGDIHDGVIDSFNLYNAHSGCRFTITNRIGLQSIYEGYLELPILFRHKHTITYDLEADSYKFINLITDTDYDTEDDDDE